MRMSGKGPPKGRGCASPGCHKWSQSRSSFCSFHGGGIRCQLPGCTKSARGSTRFCIAHGGGKRCHEPRCTKSAQGATDFCRVHGKGRECKRAHCSKSGIASGPGKPKFCKAHAPSTTNLSQEQQHQELQQHQVSSSGAAASAKKESNEAQGTPALTTTAAPVRLSLMPSGVIGAAAPCREVGCVHAAVDTVGLCLNHGILAGSSTGALPPMTTHPALLASPNKIQPPATMNPNSPFLFPPYCALGQPMPPQPLWFGHGHPQSLPFPAPTPVGERPAVLPLGQLALRQQLDFPQLAQLQTTPAASMSGALPHSALNYFYPGAPGATPAESFHTGYLSGLAASNMTQTRPPARSDSGSSLPTSSSSSEPSSKDLR